MRTFIPLCLAAVLLLPASALAAAPSNDARSAARQLSLPSSVDGTTKDSTLEAQEPPSCAPIGGSVWYAVSTGGDGRVVASVDAKGDLDATLEVFERTRSQLRPVDCESTDKDGKASLSFRPAKGSKGTNYLIRVAQRSNSVAGDFRLDVYAPQPGARAPGAALPAAGVKRTLDAFQNTDDAFSLRMRAGSTYRINLDAGSEGCVALELYPAGTRDFDSASPVRRLRCGGYLLYTPAAGEGGRYSLRAVAAARVRGPQHYRLQAGRALADDTSPGVFLSNYQRTRGSLRGLDTVDLYRFDVTRRSDLKLRLKSSRAFALLLLSDRGHRIDSTTAEDGGDLSRRIKPGRYFAAVRAPSGTSGSYSLTRVSRTITRTRIGLSGRSAPGRRVPINVRVTPGASGPVAVTVQRFDPLAGWQFFARIRTHVSGGTARVGFTPTGVGRWRARAEFAGTRGAAPSETGFSSVLVAGPLRQ